MGRHSSGDGIQLFFFHTPCKALALSNRLIYSKLLAPWFFAFSFVSPIVRYILAGSFYCTMRDMPSNGFVFFACVSLSDRHNENK